MHMRSSLKTIAILLTLTALLPACSKGKTPPPRVVPVTAETADKKDIPIQLRAIGNVEAYNTVSIKAQVNGEIAAVFFREGEDVKKGSMLFRIDPRPFEAAMRQAGSALARDRAQSKNAAAEAKRYQALAEKGFVSLQEYDNVRTNADALDAVVKADEAAVENAQVQLEYTTIIAPIDGRTGSIAVQKGNIVKANDVPLVTINQVAPIFVSFTIPEQSLSEIKKYNERGELKVEAILPGDEKRPVSGQLTFIDNAVDRTTGTIRLKGTFDNHDRRLWPGQFVDVFLTLTVEPGVVVVSSQAVQTGQQGQYVYVIKDDMSTELRVVTVERMFENKAVIAKGIAAGEKVVTDGQLRLVPGAKVEIKNAPSQEGIKEGASIKSQMTNTK